VLKQPRESHRLLAIDGSTEQIRQLALPEEAYRTLVGIGLSRTA
jgi:hypothetical protein